jgi:hypothetical protein
VANEPRRRVVSLYRGEEFLGTIQPVVKDEYDELTAHLSEDHALFLLRQLQKWFEKTRPPTP